MKAASALAVLGATVVAAQGLASLPPCAQTCITNMLALAPSLGCDGADAACLCQNPDFGYGVRDCSNAACQASPQDAQAAIAYGTQYCAEALGGANGGASGASDDASASETGTGVSDDASASETGTEDAGSAATTTDGGDGAVGAVAITTSALVAVVTSDGTEMTTTTGFTTVFSSGTAGPGASATDSASDAVSSISQSASDALSSASESIQSEASDAVETATDTSSASGSVITAAPVLAAAAMAILAL